MAICGGCNKETNNLYYGAYCLSCYTKVVSKPSMNFEDTPVKQEINNNEVLKEVHDLLEAQTAKGLAKYPRTVSEEDYNLNEWIDHAREELIDTLVYLTVIKHKIKKVIG